MSHCIAYVISRQNHTTWSSEESQPAELIEKNVLSDKKDDRDLGWGLASRLFKNRW